MEIVCNFVTHFEFDKITKNAVILHKVRFWLILMKFRRVQNVCYKNTYDLLIANGNLQS